MITPRGYLVIGCLSVSAFIFLLGLAGWIEGGMQ